jgi:hypothetical protein
VTNNSKLKNSLIETSKNGELRFERLYELGRMNEVKKEK